MNIYRIASKIYSKDLTGHGAAMHGGRWNKKGTPVVYAGESMEIALLELIVHIPPMMIPQIDAVTIKIPENSITELKSSKLPKNWRDYPAPTVLSEIAEEWVQENRSLALKVPSCIIETAHNFILNCRHPEFSKKVKLVKCVNFKFDPRLTSI